MAPMEAPEPRNTQTPFASASSSTLDETAGMEKPAVPLEAGSDMLSLKELDRDEQTVAPEHASPALEPRNDLVDFDGPDDPENPKNWSNAKRWGITVSMGLMTFVVTFASSIYSVAIRPVAEEYHIGEVPSTLGVSLFLLGFVFGPILFGPASEVFGRRVPLFAGYLVFAIFQIPVAVAQNVETIMLGRFFGGFAAAAPLAVVGGSMADIWGPIERAYGICVFAASAFTGPVAGPIIGGFVTQSYLGWRWTAWITLIMTALFGCIGLVLIPETSAARILQMKAKRLRYETQNWALHAKADESRINFKTLSTIYLVRPFVMFVQEPILSLMTAYMSFIYGILYLLFEAYPISFQEQRGWNPGVGSLPFAAFIVGIAMGTGMIAYSTRTNFTRAFKKHGKVIPEERLPPMIVGAAVLPIGLFLFAWTSDPHITWVPQVLATALLGMGCLSTFWQGTNFIIDCYGFYSNSAIAVNTFVRSIAGAGFPLFAPAMYHNLGVAWATSLLAFLCVVFFPVPVLFYIYGAKIRARSRFRPVS
ncbi:uncharacterized protein Z520_10279 [Fonsecaea multimorphosa CBS 102226]|uniref:Major facilitator superfamily (MFS) profile domain-containing protein n=1 Tax=Fonsecaea multimorphosa CBS 102226 TaxID=1442371 RepID=A0A0D2JL22_9EURO|nr:uncharacterized protein Z520_10279 [Fonsecaea multimorphosa CBS 102226]KIX93942.1 hypothetical protein Z520_10279 [Fonsecaea multimorphosa CBS 102226]OAL19290.1 hypothetical protein AYO22_09834 [Fonsecaea multimorphosa]